MIRCASCEMPLTDELGNYIRCLCNGAQPALTVNPEPEQETNPVTMQVEIFRNREEQLWAVRPLAGPYARRVAFSVSEAELSNVHIRVDARRRREALDSGASKVHTTVVGDLVDLSGFRQRFMDWCPVEEHSLIHVPEVVTELFWDAEDQLLYFNDLQATLMVFSRAWLLEDGRAWAQEVEDLL